MCFRRFDTVSVCDRQTDGRLSECTTGSNGDFPLLYIQNDWLQDRIKCTTGFLLTLKSMTLNDPKWQIYGRTLHTATRCALDWNGGRPTCLSLPGK